MALGFGNKKAAVFMSEPVRDRLEINPFLARIAYEEVPQAMMSEPRKPRNATCSTQGLPGRLSFK